MKTFTVVLACVVTASLPVARSAPAAPQPDIAALGAAAESGSATAMLELALAHDSGTTGIVDRAKAAEWYRRAAAAGAGEAHLWLGQLQEAGDGVPRDLAAARASYEAAVAAGVLKANFRLGLVYFEGWGVPRDPEKGVALFKIAAEAGYLPAQSVLADILMLGIRVPKDEAGGLAWAERAARADDPDAQVALGHALIKGTGVSRDLAQARTWFQLSAEQEYNWAMIEMAHSYLSRESQKTPESMTLGLRWLMLADEGGSPYAAFVLGGLRLAIGPRTPDRESAALDYFKRATARGHTEAGEVVTLVSNGKTVTDAFAYVSGTPPSQRYVDRLNSTPRDPVNSPPRPKTLTRPVYPDVLRSARIEGEVKVTFIVGKDGRVSDITVVSSSHPGFDVNAVAAVAEWIFEPGLKGGRPVAVKMQVPVVFALEK